MCHFCMYQIWCIQNERNLVKQHYQQTCKFKVVVQIVKTAEYTCPVWARSRHVSKLNPALHDCCRITARLIAYLHQTLDVEQPTNRCASCYQNGSILTTQSVNCDCGEPQTRTHLCCRLLDEPCTPEDLIAVTERAMACARKWQLFV